MTDKIKVKSWEGVGGVTGWRASGTTIYIVIGSGHQKNRNIIIINKNLKQIITCTDDLVIVSRDKRELEKNNFNNKIGNKEERFNNKQKKQIYAPQ